MKKLFSVILVCIILISQIGITAVASIPPPVIEQEKIFKLDVSELKPFTSPNLLVVNINPDSNLKPLEEIMSFDAQQLRYLIDRVLSEFADKAGMPWLHSTDAVELLMLTCAQETLLGKYLKQVRGPALGIFQMEPGAYQDLFDKFIVTKSNIHDAYAEYYTPGVDWKAQMMGNIPYQIVLARIYYLRIPEALPHHKNVFEMAKYYKKYWNTYLGKATVEEAVQRYHRYAI